MHKSTAGWVFAAILLACVATSGASAGQAGWIKLFNGKDLRGWTKMGGEAEYRVEDGTIVGTSVPNSENTFLCTKRMYSDFILEFEVRVDDELNSGVQFRSNAYPSYHGGRVHGYQVEIEASPGEAGHVWDEARRRKWLSAGREQTKKVFRNGEWNSYRVVCRGNRIRTRVNGKKIADFTDDMTDAGFIGLQVHGVGERKKPLHVRWRNIRLKPLDSGEWESLFNGRSLDGWRNPYSRGKARVKNGEIRLSADRAFYLLSDEVYGDFVFESEVKLPAKGSNSGIQFRSHLDDGEMKGLQAEIAGGATGTLYDMTPHARHNSNEDRPSAKQAFQPGEWNVIRIDCRGDHIRIFVNGVRVTNLFFARDLVGHFALQHHGEAGKVYRFRNIRVNSRGRHTWKPLFNGKNLEGWHTHPGGKWRVEDGILVGTCSEDTERYGLLISDEEYSDFTVRLAFLPPKGDSGFYFRSRETESRVGIKGFQVQIHRRNGVGGLYETGGRKWTSRPAPEFIENVMKPNDWNRMIVTAHGDRVAVYLNNRKSAEMKGNVGWDKGHFALQLHAHMDVVARFKDIEILRRK